VDKKRTWFKHTCWFCGLESREVDFIVGDGVYQCHFENRPACQERHDHLDPVAFARFPKPFCDRTRDWSPGGARSPRRARRTLVSPVAPA